MYLWKSSCGCIVAKCISEEISTYICTWCGEVSCIVRTKGEMQLYTGVHFVRRQGHASFSFRFHLQSATWLLIFSNGATATSGPGPPHYRGFTITLRHTTLGRTPLFGWSARRRPDNILQTQETDIHASGEIRTHTTNMRTTADPRLRPRGSWHRQLDSSLLPTI
jgi:hypothetical protein